MAWRSGCGSCFAWRRPSHADPTRESRSRTRGGEWYVVEDASIAAQEAPPARAGHARPGDRPCGRRCGFRDLVADESERAAGHRRAVRCRGVPRFPRSRRSECLRIPSASERKAHSHPGDGLGQGRSTRTIRSSRGRSRIRALREWAGENREALELFLQGADQPDASLPAGDPTTRMDVGSLDGVAFLEASRRQESGDTAGAWDCYRAVLRMITHIRRRGNTGSALLPPRARTVVCSDGSPTGRRIRGPRPAQLHTALDEVLKNEPNPDWDISAIKSGYLELMHEIERPMSFRVQQEIEGEWTFRLGDMALSPTMIESSRGGAPLPLARARTQPARPAAALCPIPGARGNPRAAAAEASRLGQVHLRHLNQPGDDGLNQGAALPCQSGGTGRGPRATTAGAGRLAGRNPRCQAANRERRALALATGSVRTAGLFRTARHTVSSSSCWPRRSIAASAGACHLPTKPWSGPISRACPTTDRLTLTTKRRRPSSRPEWPSRSGGRVESTRPGTHVGADGRAGSTAQPGKPGRAQDSISDSSLRSSFTWIAQPVRLRGHLGHTFEASRKIAAFPVSTLIVQNADLR